MHSSATGGVKPMAIAGRFFRERERLIGMTEEERTWRMNWLKDQVLSHNEPRHVPEIYKAQYNIIRRLYRAPLDGMAIMLEPILGKRIHTIRFFAGKMILGYVACLYGFYYMKYNPNDWTRLGGWRTLTSRTAVLPEKSILFMDVHDQINVMCEVKPEMQKQHLNSSSEETELFNGVEIARLTKSQMKKYKRMQQWQAIKKDKRAKEKLRTKKKKITAKLMNIEIGPSRKQLKNSKMVNSACKIGIVIDLSFDELMINKDMGKVIKQILRVYTENRRASAPMQLHLTNFNGKSKEEMSKHNGYENWDMHFHNADYLDVFPKEKLIYLSSESDNVIEKLEQDKVYIIGGLVDHNAHKVKINIIINAFIVFEIMLRVSEGKSFKEAFEMVLPKRINMQPTETTD
ncbi:hypothetical protein FQR65_LT14677 [Abscondita terminalis]|nr:hypothetical protein FQR65_LT14677 [Abscondita terminalis]